MSPLKLIDYWNEPHLKPIYDWLMSIGFVREEMPDGELIGIAWSGRSGYDSTSLEFWPHMKGCDAIIGHHASGTNPRMAIGTCESLADVQAVYETIRQINGYPTMEPHRYKGPISP